MKRRNWLIGLFSIVLILISLVAANAFAAAQSALASEVSINEIQVSTTGSDWEFFEIRGAPATDLSDLTLLVVESDDQSTAGNIDKAISLAGQSIPDDGFWLGISPAGATEYGVTGELSVPDNTFENSTTGYLLVSEFSGAVGDDLDTDNNGVMDVAPWTAIFDGFTLWDSGSTDHAYIDPVLGPDGSFLPSGVYRCPDAPAGEFVDGGFLSFGSSDGSPGENNASQCGTPSVALNEIQASTTSTDWEFFELQGASGTDLSELTLLVIEADDQTSAGNIDRAISLAGQSIPDDGFWLGISPAGATEYGVTGDLSIDNNTFENSTTSYLLVTGFSGALNDDLDTDNDGSLDASPWTGIVDGLTLWDSGSSDHSYIDPILGPDGSFLPSGVYRCPNAPSGVFEQGNFLDFSTSDGTPGVSNTQCPNVEPPQFLAFDMVNSTSQNLITFIDDPAIPFTSAADGFNKFQRGVSASIPYDVLDDSAGSYPPDDMGIIKTGNVEEFFGILDTENGDTGGRDVVATWIFNIGGATDLGLSIDMGAMGDFESADYINWSYSIDGSPFQTAFQNSVDEDGSHVYTLESGTVITLSDPMLVNDVLLDNNLQTHTAVITGTGNVLTLTLTANTNGGDEAVAFQNVIIEGSGGTNIFPPVVVGTSPLNGAEYVALNANVEIEFSEPVSTTSGWYDFMCGRAPITATISGGPDTYVLDPVSDLAATTVCTVTVLSQAIASIGPPSVDMAQDYSFSFTTTDVCGDPATFIHEVQGPGASSPLEGQTATIEGVVVGDFQSSSELNGFFVQEEDADFDGDPDTSEGVFVYESSFAAPDVVEGDLVRVTGVVDEYKGLTQLSSIANVSVCDTQPGSYGPVIVTLPENTNGDLEKVEGMNVTLTQTMSVAQNYFLGRYGQLTLSSDLAYRLYNPTNQVLPNSPESAALFDYNARNLLFLDDGVDASSCGDNPVPVPYIGAAPPSILRGGDYVSSLTGVLDYGQINSAACGNSSTLEGRDYRLHPTLVPVFTNTNARTAAPEDVGGELTVVAFNVLNFFNGDGQGGGFPTSRGAYTYNEFVRQRIKIFEALIAIDGDIVGLMEIENDGFDQYSAIAELVKVLNDGPCYDTTLCTDIGYTGTGLGAGTYAYIDAGPGPVGTDEITVGYLYKTASVIPAGDPVIVDEAAFTDPNGSGRQRNRPAIVQTFVDNDGGIFSVIVNHLKSKGSSCGAGDDDPEQGSCNVTRALAAEYLVDTVVPLVQSTSEDFDVIIIGDMNAYAKEDPIAALELGGFTNVVTNLHGAFQYSYTFDGAVGTLDYALGNSSLLAQVTGATIWHINTDEPVVTDYEEYYNPPGYWSPDPYRASDHDPVIVGLSLAPSLAGFTSNSPVVIGNLSVFTNTTTDRAIMSYVWDFGDGSATVTDTNATHLYAAAGTFTVILTATNPGGTSVYTDQHVVLPEPPIASFTSNSPVVIGNLSVFTNTTTDRSIFTYEWDFGDGSATVTDTNATHLYAAAGTFTVVLTATNPGGSSVYTDQHVVLPEPPVASFTSNSPVFVGLQSVFTNTTTGAPPITYEWDFGDGSATVTDTNATHLYAAAGTFTVILTATNPGGTSVYTDQHVVLPEPPIASFTSNSPVFMGLPAVFTNTTTGAPPITYEWNFGDGSPVVTDTHPLHTYILSGTYTVVLTATNLGGTDVYTDTVEVIDEPYDPTSVNLSDLSGANGTSQWLWILAVILMVGIFVLVVSNKKLAKQRIAKREK